MKNHRIRIFERIVSVLLLAFLIAPAYACSQKTDVTSDDTDLTDTAAESEVNEAVSDDLGEYNFDGREFRVIVANGREYEISAEQTGAIEDDSVYERNAKISERFNVKFTVSSEDLGDYYGYTKMIASATAGDDSYDLFGGKDYTAFNPITAGICRNWYNITNVNLDKPWYSKASNDSATINGILYMATCDLSLTSMQYTYAMFCNAGLITDYGYTKQDMYDLVNDGQWTIDKFSSIAADIYSDINGDGSKDIDDLYGYMTNSVDTVDVWPVAFGIDITGRDDSNRITVVFVNDKTSSAIDRIIDLNYNNAGTFLFYKSFAEEDYFPKGNNAFCSLMFRNCFDKCRDMTDDYTILPFPKWDEAQSSYLTHAMDEFTVYGCPVTVKGDSVEFVGTIFEALNAYSYKDVYPAYYDVALKGKYSSDEQTSDMVDLIMNGRRFDFCYQFGVANFQRLPYWFRDLVTQKNDDISAMYDKNVAALEQGLTDLYALYRTKE